MNSVTWETYGLSEANGRCITDVLSRCCSVREAILFGSRAKGNYKPGSDIDIAVKGDISKDDLARLLAAFEETTLPYFVGMVVYGNLKNEALREHIDRVGKPLFTARPTPRQ